MPQVLHGGDFFRSRGHTRQLARKLVNDKNSPILLPAFFFRSTDAYSTASYFSTCSEHLLFEDARLGRLGMTTHLPRLTLQGKARFFFDRSNDRSRSRLRITRAGQKERSTPNPSLTKDRSFDQDLYGRLRSYPTVVTSYFRTTEIARSVDAGFRSGWPPPTYTDCTLHHLKYDKTHCD